MYYIGGVIVEILFLKLEQSIVGRHLDLYPDIFGLGAMRDFGIRLNIRCLGLFEIA